MNGVVDTFGDDDSEEDIDDDDHGDVVRTGSSAARPKWRLTPHLGSKANNSHEDSQADHDDDDVVRVASGVAAAAPGLAGNPPLGFRANSLASMMTGPEGPTCQLQDHPIQVRFLFFEKNYSLHNSSINLGSLVQEISYI